jgi:hypothetical protein
MFRDHTDYERITHIYNYLFSSRPCKHEKDLGDIYQIESDGTDLKFFDMVKARRTGKTYAGKEILLLNVTPYGYVNLEGTCKFTLMSALEQYVHIVLFGFEIKSFDEEMRSNWGILTRKRKRRGNYVNGTYKPNYLETEDEWMHRAKETYAMCKKISKGLFHNFVYYFVGDDHQMVKPVDFTGYYYYLARCLNDVSGRSWRRVDNMMTLETFFGSNAKGIDEKYQEYLDVANILGVEAKIGDVTCNYNSLEEIQTNVKSRIYVFYEVAKYFFKNGRQFKDVDHKNIKKRCYNIRMIYSALGGNLCMKEDEEGDLIAYFTALRISLEELPLLINTPCNPAYDVLKKRFSIAR